MSSTQFNFQYKYYEYGLYSLKKLLVIGGYKSAVLSDSVAPNIFDLINTQFNDFVLRRTYIDDGLLVFKGRK